MLKDISQENEVEEKDDLSSRENNETMSPKKFKPNFKNDKCFLAVFISHGISGLIKMKEDFLSVQNDILRHFRGNNCKNLLEKPKIFIFGVSIKISTYLIVYIQNERTSLFLCFNFCSIVKNAI